jgi:hypothetical protein
MLTIAGGAGTVSGAAGTVVNPSSVPTGWQLVNTATGGLTITLSAGTDADGYPEFVMQISGTPTTANATVYIAQAMNTANLAPNDNISLGMREVIDAGNTGVRGLNGHVRLTGTASFVSQDMSAAGGANTGGDPFAAGFDGAILTPPAPVPAGTLTVSQIRAGVVQMDQGVAVSATIRIGRVSPRKI